MDAKYFLFRRPKARGSELYTGWEYVGERKTFQEAEAFYDMQFEYGDVIHTFAAAHSLEEARTRLPK